MARVYVFDDWKSILHFLFGLSIYLLAPLNILFPVVGTVFFTIYEATERENPVSTLGDFEEFILGALVGISLWWF